MASENDYRLLLKRAQDCTDEVGDFIRALKEAPLADARTRELAAATEVRVRELDREIELLWDHFKRLKPTGCP